MNLGRSNGALSAHMHRTSSTFYMARPKQILRRGQKEELLFCPEGVHKVHMTHATKPSGVLLLLGTHVLIKYACCYSYAVVHTP